MGRIVCRLSALWGSAVSGVRSRIGGVVCGLLAPRPDACMQYGLVSVRVAVQRGTSPVGPGGGGGVRFLAARLATQRATNIMYKKRDMI